jgi:hypothetical protein
MAESALYVIPVAGDGTTGTRIRISWPTGVGITEIEDLPVRSRQQARSPAGGAYHVQYGAYRALTIRVTGLVKASHQDFIDRLAAADSQLTMGALCHFAQDRNKAGLWPVTNSLGTLWAVPAQGATTIYYGAELLSIETAPALGSGDDLIVETEPPESHESQHRVSSATGSSFTLPASNGIFFDSSASKAVVRHAEFWPYLRLADSSLSQPRLRRVGAMAWTWEASFETAPVDYFALVTGSGPGP